MKYANFCLVGTLLFTTLLLAGEPRWDLNTWVEKQQVISLANLERNISPLGAGLGAIVASPSKKNPDYWYHWIRDAALVMDVVVDLYENAEHGSAEKAHYLKRILDYIDFSKLNQDTPNPSGGLGEPKFNADGSAFWGSWGRPQDDGPALRALTLIHFARVLIREGDFSFVTQKLYTEGQRVSSVIKRDLEYVSHHWQNTSFDLWEEVKGHHFFTAMAQRRSLMEGAELALLLGDNEAGGWYKVQADKMVGHLERFWKSSKGIVLTTIDRDGGIDYKYSGQDASVILGAFQAGDKLFSVQDDRIISTFETIQNTFKDIYPINKNSVAGVGIGRYPEDRYDGYSSGGQGNPWVLLTCGFAEYNYRLARALKEDGYFQITPRNISFFQRLGAAVHVGKVFNREEGEFQQIYDSLVQKGDDYLERVKYHADPDGQLSEQMNRRSGFMQGARDLTWSYASFLTAETQRRIAKK